MESSTSSTSNQAPDPFHAVPPSANPAWSHTELCSSSGIFNAYAESGQSEKDDWVFGPFRAGRFRTFFRMHSSYETRKLHSNFDLGSLPISFKRSFPLKGRHSHLAALAGHCHMREYFGLEVMNPRPDSSARPYSARKDVLLTLSRTIKVRFKSPPHLGLSHLAA